MSTLPNKLLTVEEVCLLINIERDMASGKQPHVVCNGSRWAFPGEVLAAVGLEIGETVTNSVCYQLQLLNLQYLTEQIEKLKAEKLQSELLEGL